MDESIDTEFFITSMSGSRPADFCIGYDGGSVFIDFNRLESGHIKLIRISFDGYGCYGLPEDSISLTVIESRHFEQIIKDDISDQGAMSHLIRTAIARNIEYLSEDSLKEYKLI